VNHPDNESNAEVAVWQKTVLGGEAAKGE